MKQTTNPLLAWIAENFKRLTVKSPAFFKIWKIILGIPSLLVALPEAIETVLKPITIIHLPQIFNDHVTTIVAWASAVAWFITFLPTDSSVVGVDQNGTAIKQSEVNKLPYTAIQEEKQLQKEVANTYTPEVPTVILNNPVSPVEKK